MLCDFSRLLCLGHRTLSCKKQCCHQPPPQQDHLSRVAHRNQPPHQLPPQHQQLLKRHHWHQPSHQQQPTHQRTKSILIMASVADLDEDTIMAARMAFNLYARDENTLTGDLLLSALRSLSINPTTKEVMDKCDENDEMDMEPFMTLIAENQYNGYADANGQGKAEVMAAFEAFDVDGTGKIDAAELLHILTASGEELDSSEAKAALKKAGSGAIDYAAFVDGLFQGVPATSSGGGGSKAKPKAKAAPAKAKAKAAPKPAADDGFGGGFDDDDGFGNDDDGDDFGF
eukprot:m.141133 g.141133  ORF g.141133 m.141133 type:complete len:286 (+) comp30165_c2_seq3:440-1297(+)